MATVLRNIDPIIQSVADAHNDLKAQIGAGAFFHLDKSEVTVTAANATDLATSLVLCNQAIAVYRFHFADTLALKAADATALPALGAAIDLASANTAANLIKTSHATHIASTAAHYAADATNTVLTANATDLTTLMALLNDIKAKINAHMASGPAGKSLRVVSA